MDVVSTWTGRSACALQEALRLTNEAFAALFPVATRTVASWHADPSIEPRPDIQAALDTMYARAGEAVRGRFAILARPRTPTAEVQALRVAIAIVVRGDDVLLVCRRGDDSLSWQFPAGMVKPGRAPEGVAVQETLAETGVHCAVRAHLGSRIHPATGVLASYQLCDYLTGDAANLDEVENMAVAWVSRADLPRFIPTDRIYPPVLTALETA